MNQLTKKAIDQLALLMAALFRVDGQIKRCLSPEEYQQYLKECDVQPFRQREVEAWREHHERCGQINDDASAQKLALINLPWPVGAGREEQVKRDLEYRQIFDEQSAALQQSRRCAMAITAEAKADEASHKTKVMQEIMERRLPIAAAQ